MVGLEVPSPESVLWRYIDFTKYVSLLSTKGLYLPRADRLNDPFEGAKGLLARKKDWDDFYREFFRHAIKNPPAGSTNTKTDAEVEQEAQRLLNELEAGTKTRIKCTFISCWHENSHESEAMWKLYSSFLDNAIAIKTNYANLKNALNEYKDRDIPIGRVQYIDFDKEYAGINEVFWRKRKSLQHEREVRAVHLELNNELEGFVVNCDLKKLITEVVVSPTTDEWFWGLVIDVTKTFGFDFKISKSRLYEPAFY